MSFIINTPKKPDGYKKLIMITRKILNVAKISGSSLEKSGLSASSADAEMANYPYCSMCSVDHIVLEDKMRFLEQNADEQPELPL